MGAGEDVRRPELRPSGTPLSGQPTCAYSFTGNWAPRLGVTVDPLGNRKSKAYFSFGRIFERIPLDMAQRSLGGEASVITTKFGATALDPFTGAPIFNPFPGGSIYIPSGSSVCGDGVNYPISVGVICTDDAVDPLGTCNLLAGGAPTAGLLPDCPLEGNPFITGGVGTYIAAGTKQQFLDEFVLGSEQELSHGFFIRARYLDRRIKRIVEDVSVLTVEAANAGLQQQYVITSVTPSTDVGQNPACLNPAETVFDGCPISGFDFSNPIVGLALPDGIPDGFPAAIRNYQAVEVSLERRLRDNWQMFINYRIAKLFGNFEGSFRNDNGQVDPNIQSLFDFTRSVGLAEQFTPGLLPTDRVHIVNFYGSYMINSGWANGLNIGSSLRVESGVPISKLLHHPAYFNAGEIASGGRGSQGKTRVQGVFDLHFDYPWKITERFTLRGALDLFNLFNAQRITLVDEFAELSGGGANPDFLTPLAFQRPFHTRFALRFEW